MLSEDRVGLEDLDHPGPRPRAGPKAVDQDDGDLPSGIGTDQGEARRLEAGRGNLGDRFGGGPPGRLLRLAGARGRSGDQGGCHQGRPGPSGRHGTHGTRTSQSMVRHHLGVDRVCDLGTAVAVRGRSVVRRLFGRPHLYLHQPCSLGIACGDRNARRCTTSLVLVG
jgi:hypothetical protein